MSRDALKTLFHPFESGDLPPPSRGQRGLFLGARPGFRLPEEFEAIPLLVQGFRPDFLALQREGFAVVPEPQGEDYNIALVLAGRHRGENELRLAEAIGRVKPDGLIVMAGDKTDGVASLRQRLERSEDRGTAGIATPVPIAGHLSKHHGVVFWLTRTPEAERFAERTRQSYGARPLIDGRFTTEPGMFSHDRVDPGSKLLVEALPPDLSGKVADFCAGWGYLSAEVAARCPGIRSIDLYEADHASLEAARRNLSSVTDRVTQFFWRDLLSEPVEARYDTVVMNPPFHQGRAAEPEIGQKLIAAAAKALRSRGVLFLVANKGLPYEKALAASFAEHQQIAGDGAFKVFAARR
jgi:16S rRNA (guanine1207-N2)-methyltransferase